MRLKGLPALNFSLQSCATANVALVNTGRE